MFFNRAKCRTVSILYQTFLLFTRLVEAISEMLKNNNCCAFNYQKRFVAFNKQTAF